MARLYLVAATQEIARRRGLLPPDRLVEVWHDLYVPGQSWIGEASKALLDAVGPPLAARVALDGTRVPIYYGPRLQDLESLPLEESLQARVLSAHGLAAVWITLDRFGQRVAHEPQGPTDPVFFLRRPGGTTAHVWRLFRRRSEAEAYMAESFAADPEALEWARSLPAGSYEELIARHAAES